MMIARVRLWRGAPSWGGAWCPPQAAVRRFPPARFPMKPRLPPRPAASPRRAWSESAVTVVARSRHVKQLALAAARPPRRTAPPARSPPRGSGKGTPGVGGAGLAREAKGARVRAREDRKRGRGVWPGAFIDALHCSRGGCGPCMRGGSPRRCGPGPAPAVSDLPRRRFRGSPEPRARPPPRAMRAPPTDSRPIGSAHASAHAATSSSDSPNSSRPKTSAARARGPPSAAPSARPSP